MKIWSLDDARVVRSIDHTEGKITCMAFRADSQYLITGGEDCSCKLWELSSGKLTQVILRTERTVLNYFQNILGSRRTRTIDNSSSNQ